MIQRRAFLAGLSSAFALAFGTKAVRKSQSDRPRICLVSSRGRSAAGRCLLGREYQQRRRWTEAA